MNYKTLGIMLDCSRNAVTNVKTVKRFIEIISDLGYNALELYMEDTMKVDGEPYLGYMRGGYSAAEIRELDEFAKAHGIELMPAVQTLAHFTNAVKLDEYAEITDVNDILLIGEERAYQLIDNIFATVSKNFTSKRVNIGMDEAHLVGLGKYLDKHGFTNRNELLCKHLEKVSEIAEKYGLQLHMWSDMFFRLNNNGEYYSRTPVVPDNAAELIPANVAPVYWDYYHKEEADYDAMFKAHKKFGRDTWFAGGIWSWVGFSPLNDHTLETMKPALRSVNRNGVQNVIFTMWGDDGKETSFFSLLPAIYAVSRYACGEFNDKKIKREFKQKFGIGFDEYMSLDLPNKCNISERETFAAKSELFQDPFMGQCDEYLERLGEIPFADYAKKITRAGKKAGEFAYIFQCETDLCKVLEIKSRLGINIRKAYAEKDKAKLAEIATDMKKLNVRIKKFYSSLKTLWFKENKPFGFEIQDARIGGLMLRIDSCRERIEQYINTDEPLEELDEVLLKVDRALFYNSYRNVVSTSNI